MTEVPKPTTVEASQLEALYKLADKKEQVNWGARYKPEPDLLVRLINPLYDFTVASIQKVTAEKNDLRVVIGLSGGLDSSTSALIAAESMRRASWLRIATPSSLVMLSFQGMSEEDLEYARRFAEYLGSTYSDLPIYYQERDLTRLIKQTEAFTDDIITASGKPRRYSGSSATRLIDMVVLEYADKTGHCAIDSTNGTEFVLGEFVIGAGAEYAPISDFYKSQVYDLAQFIGVPQFIIDRSPINSTYGTDKVTSYFGEIPEGLTPRDIYAVLDPALYAAYDKKYSPKLISQRLGHSLVFAKNVHQKVEQNHHRRWIPFFAVDDKRLNFRRIAQGILPGEIKEYMDKNFLAI